MSDFYAQLEQQLVAAGRRRNERSRMRRALAGRGRPLAGAGALAAAIAAAVLFVAPGQREVVRQRPAARAAPVVAAPAAATDLRGIRVAVLNATTQPGLARATAAVLMARHARITTTGNAANQQVLITKVRHRRGARAQALKVAGVLGVGRVSSYKSSRPTVGRSDVVVLVGADRRDRPPEDVSPRPPTVQPAPPATPPTP
jgi:hypothetical protein